MTFRRAIFWTHLVVGVAAGLFVLLMSVTGVLIAYERQILDWVESGYDGAAPAQPMSADALAAAAAELEGSPRALRFVNREGAAVGAEIGRGDRVYLDPSSGEVLGDNASAAADFFETVEHLHRWLALEGENRAVGKTILDAANLGFLFLVASGLYLWFPKRWRRIDFRLRLFFRRRVSDGKARDFNWHHVFGFWALIPLLFVVATAVVFSYQWANDLVYAAYGEEAPQGRRGPPRGGPGPERGAAQGEIAAPISDVADVVPGPLQAILEDAQSFDPNWRTITLSLPRGGQTVQAQIDPTIGRRPQDVVTLTYALDTAERVGQSDFSDQTPARQARIVIRFLHTGEVLGFWGQTLAALASIAACFLVWTGLALAWRRLIRPLFRRKSA